MCGDIMSVWNVKSVVAGLIHHTGTVNVALMNVVSKLENRQSLNTNNLTSTRKHYNDGTNHQQGQRLKGDTEASHRPKSWLSGVLKTTKTATPTSVRLGIENTDTDAEIIMQGTLTERLLSKSSIHSETNALSVAVRQSRLTILFHCQKVAQTILITYNHYVNPVTLGKATDESYL